MADIGQKIKERREYLKMTQDDLAKKLGYKSKSTINKIELGINDIPQSKIQSFAIALETTIAFLMGIDDTEMPATDKSDEHSVRELEFIQLLRRMSHEQQEALYAYLKAGTKD